MPMTLPTLHASAILHGYRGILIRGASGSGKSRLAWQLLQDMPFARLIGDDRLVVQPIHGRLLMRPAPALQGLIEIRGLGIRRVPFEPVAVASLVVDLAAADAQRLPEPETALATVEGVRLARLPVAPDADALAMVSAYLRLGAASSEPESPMNKA